MSPQPPVADGGWGWLVLLGAFTAQLLFSAAVPLVGIYMVEWQEAFGVGAGDVAIIATELYIGIFVTTFTGALCRRFGCRPVMLCGGFLATVATFVGSFSTKLWHLYTYAAIAGIAHAFALFPTMIIPRFYFERLLGTANGIVFAGMSCGILVMAPVIEKLCATYGWKGAMLIQSALTANYLVCGALFRPSRLETHLMNVYKSSQKATPRSTASHHELEELNPAQKEKTLSNLSQALHKFDKLFDFASLMTNRLYVVLAVVGLLNVCGHVATVLFIPPMLVHDLGFTKSTASLVMSVYGLSGLITRFLHGFLLDYKVMTTLNMYLLCLVISGIPPILSPLVTPLALHFVLTVVFGIGTGATQALALLLCREFVPINEAANAIALQGVSGGVGILIGTLLMGKLHDATGSYDIPFYINGALLLFAAMILGFVTKCLRWKPAHLITDTRSAEDKDLHIQEVEDAITSRDAHDEPIKTGYQQLPTSNNNDET